MEVVGMARKETKRVYLLHASSGEYLLPQHRTCSFRQITTVRGSGGQMASAPTPPAPLVVQDGICVKWRCITKQMMWRGITFVSPVKIA